MPDEATTAKRDLSIDALKGCAILLVMLGHVVITSVQGYETSDFYDIIWALQMPLFFCISGYVLRYSKHDVDAVGLPRYAWWKTRAYLLPWLIWTVIRGFKTIMHTGGAIFEYLQTIVWSMDSGYWFLYVLWVISLSFGLAKWISGKFARAGAGIRPLLTALMLLLPCALLIALGAVFGGSFLGVQLTLFYVPFFTLGYLFGCYGDLGADGAWTKRLKSVVTAICIVAFAWLVLRYPISVLKGSIRANIIRVAASVTGCVTAASAMGWLQRRAGCGRCLRALSFFGERSMEYYVIHLLLLSSLSSATPYLCGSFGGALLILVNFLLMLSASTIVMVVLKSNALLNRILFAR